MNQSQSSLRRQKGGILDHSVPDFYEALAPYYHLIFEDWNRAVDRQAKVLDQVLKLHFEDRALNILDCACGIGTQALGFAKFGHTVMGSDLSQAAVKRARDESRNQGLDISFVVSDMTSLSEIVATEFDVVAIMDNALPHLSNEQLPKALRAVASKLAPNGRLIASIRDYDGLVRQRPTVQQPAFYGGLEERRIVHQVWDWIDDTRYVAHLYITVNSNQAWTTHHFVAEYRSILRSELSDELTSVGFSDVQWIMPVESGYYQPIVVAKWA